MSFHQALDLIFELDETTVRCTWDILRQRDCLDQLSKIPWVILTFVVIDGETKVHGMSIRFALTGWCRIEEGNRLRRLDHNLTENCVEDVQLGVESYQKKLNLTKPQEDFPNISTKEPYTPSFDPPRVVYEDSRNRKRLMRADELYKFSDETLMLVREKLHYKVLNFIMGYNKGMPKRNGHPRIKED
nr:hypothetical protein [Tanacetum cinerariifolium]